MIALKYPKRGHDGEEEEGEEWIWEEEAWYWEEEEEEGLPICFGDYGRYTICMSCEFAVACSEVRAREEAAMADALGLLED